jgi:hypothetical protein
MYVDAHANAMLEFLYKPGETVAVWMPESPEKVVFYLILKLSPESLQAYYEIFFSMLLCSRLPKWD